MEVFEKLAEVFKSNKFRFDAWYLTRIGDEMEKDFDSFEIEAESKEEAVDLAIKRVPYNLVIFLGGEKVAHGHKNELTGKIV